MECEMYRKLKELNKHIQLQEITDEEFSIFGKILEGIEFPEINEYMKSINIPKEGNIYIAQDEKLEKFAMQSKEMIEQKIYGGMPIQIGYCNGQNSSLNGLEYHKGSEINIAITDFILFLGRVQDINKNTFDITNVKAFYIPKGTAIEMYSTTLHFSPCKTEEIGFKCVVILPRGTNTPIDLPEQKVLLEEELLFMKNKWLMAHPERKPLIEKGAYPGIIGENLQIHFITN